MHPSYSVIVPTYNRPGMLDDCLQALSRIEYPGDCFEILIVNDGGFVTELPILPPALNVRMIQQDKNLGPGAARNLGASQAQYDFLAFTDDDCRPDPRWLSALASIHKEFPGFGVGGRTRNALAANACSAASHSVQEVMHHYFNREPRNCLFFPTNNFSVPRADFLALGGFNEAYRTSEDREFCDRWLLSGRTLAYASEAIVDHAHDLAVRSLFAQHFAYGKGAFRFYSGRKQRGRPGLSIDLQFYRYLLLHPFQNGNRRRLRLFASILITQLANAAGYAWERVAGIS